jgi:T4 RnlA family RNA ligase
MNYILTYDDAKRITKLYNNFNFSEHTYRIENYNISTFDYFICSYENFSNPIGDSSINAFDMRGTTFVFNKDGSLWKRFLMLPKFFNLNQVEETQYDIIKEKNISHISEKEDGSLIAFMMLPNGNLFCKTCRGFSNEQVINSMKLLNQRSELVKWVKKTINDGYTPLFEYVSWDNRIVLKYSQPDIRLIGIRDNYNGDFVPASWIVDTPISLIKIKEETATLDELINRAKIEENREGWVIMFDDRMMVKIKTMGYYNIHELRTENAFREDYIIKNYYNRTLDDIISQLDPKNDIDVIEFIKAVTNAIDNYSINIDNKVEILYNKLKEEFKGNWVAFASKCNKEPYFTFLRHYENKDEYNKRKIDFILQKTYRLKNAKEIVEKWKTKS